MLHQRRRGSVARAAKQCLVDGFGSPRQHLAHDVLSQHPTLHRRPRRQCRAYVCLWFVHFVLSLGIEGGLSADKSWGDFHMITDRLSGLASCPF